MNDRKTVLILGLVVLFSVAAGAGLMRLALKPGAGPEAAMKPGSVDVAFNRPATPGEAPAPVLPDGLASQAAIVSPISAAKPAVLPLPMKGSRPPQTAAQAPKDAQAPPGIDAANFFNYGLGKETSRSGAELAVGAGSGGSPSAAPRRQLQRLPSIGQARTPVRMAGKGFSAPSRPPAAEAAAALGGGPLKTYLNQTFGVPDGSMTVPLKSFETTTPARPAATTGGSENPRGGSTTGGIDTRLHPIDTATPGQPSYTPPSMKPLSDSFSMSAGNTLSFTVANLPEDRTVVCYEVLEHPCASPGGIPNAGTYCEDPAHYASFHGNTEWKTANGGWVGTFRYIPAMWGCAGIRVRFVFADKKTGAHTGGAIDVAY